MNPLFGMDADAVHLAINHLPVVLSLLGAAAAAIAFVMRRRALFLYAVSTLVLAGASSYPVLRTGHTAAEQIEDRWYVDKVQIERHHDTAENANLLMLGTGALALVGWWLVLRSPREAKPGMLLMTAVLVAGVCSATAMGWTSWQGGYIVSRNARLVRSAPPGAAKGDSASVPAAMDHSGH
jgi:uncharacterized membrane protein